MKCKYGNCTVTPEFCARRHHRAMNGSEVEFISCKDCSVGIESYKKLKKQLDLKKTEKFNPDFSHKKRGKKGRSPYTSHFAGSSKGRITGFEPVNEGSIPSPVARQTLYDLELLLKAQVTYAFELIYEGKLNDALERIKLINQETDCVNQVGGNGR